MATTMTLAGPRNAAVRFFNNLRLRPRQLGDVWTDDQTAAAALAPSRDPFGDAVAAFAKSAVGWGVLAFAVWSAGIQVKRSWDRG